MPRDRQASTHPNPSLEREGLFCFFALLLATPAAAAPPRIVSINLCADQYLLALLPPERIAAVTWLARDPQLSPLATAAARVRVTHGSAEEALALSPDLVLAGSFTTPATRSLLRRLGRRVVELGPTESFADIRRTTLAMGTLLGADRRARALVRRMDARLAWLAAHPLPGHPRVLAFEGGGASPGRATLYGAIIAATGARNVADETASRRASFGLEALVARAPAILLQPVDAFAGPDRRGDIARHPLIRTRWAGRRIAVPQSIYGCGTPFSADAATRLRAALAGVR